MLHMTVARWPDPTRELPLEPRPSDWLNGCSVVARRIGLDPVIVAEQGIRCPTLRQMQVLAVVAELAAREQPITYRDVQARLGVRSLRTANELLCSLRRRNLISIEPVAYQGVKGRKAVKGSLQVTPAGYAMLAAWTPPAGSVGSGEGIPGLDAG